MRSNPCYPALVKHNDLVGVKDRADALRNDQCRNVLRLLLQRTAQSYVRLVIER